MDLRSAAIERFAASAASTVASPDAVAADPRDFRVTTPAEIERLLEALCDRGVLLDIAVRRGDGGGGGDGAGGGVSGLGAGAGVKTRLCTVDAPRRLLGFEAVADDARLPPLLAADDVVAVGYLDRIRLQFDVGGLLRVHAADACTLRCAWPAELMRFQRRDGYRVRSLPAPGAYAALRHPALADRRLSLRVIDLSIGGCALLLPDDVPDDVPGIQPGLRINGVQLQLDAGTRIDSLSLLLRHVTHNGPASHAIRLGCEWAGPLNDAERTLQRWIDQTQRKRLPGL